MLLMDASNFCTTTAEIWQLVGYVVLIFKIVIPLILIILGMVDLGRAVVSSDEKAISKSISSLVKRFVAAVIIFFIPSIVDGIFQLINLMNTTNNNDYAKCFTCVTNVNNCDTEGAVSLTGDSTSSTSSSN